MPERSLVIRLIGDDRSLHQTFTKSTRESKAFAASLSRTAKTNNVFAASAGNAVRATGGFSRGFLSGAGALSSFGGALALTSGSFFAGAGIIAGLKGAVTAAADFQQTMNVLQQVSGATAAQMALASDEARKLGADISLPATSATDAAVAMQQLAKGGLNITQALGAARGTLQLAAAAQTDVGTAANTTARALTAFGLSGENAGAIADALANAANSATGDIVDFAIGLSQSATSAHQFGLTAQDTVTALTELAKAGIVGSDAGTSLRVMLGRLIPSSKAAREEMKKLGVHVADAQGNFLPFRDIIDQYAKSLQKLPSAQRQQALQTIFGTDAQRAANIILGAGVDKYDKLRAAVGKQGGAAKAAAAQQKGFKGALDGFNSALNTTAVALGTGILPPLTVYLKHLSTWLSDTETQAELQKDFNGVFSTTKGLLEGFVGVVKDVDRVTGGFKNTVELLIALKLGLVLRGWTKQLIAFEIAAGAGGAGGKATTLGARIAEIARIGTLAVAFRFPGLGSGLARLSRVAELGGLLSAGMIIPVTFAFAADRAGLNSLAPDLLKQIKSLGGKGSLADKVENLFLGGRGHRGVIGNLLSTPEKPPESDLRISAAKVAKETTDFNKRVARKAEETVSKNPVVVNASKGLKITADQRNTFFDNSISRILLRGGLGDIKAQIAALQKANALIGARLKVTKDVTRRLTLEDELLQNAAQIKSLNAQAAADALSKRQASMQEFISNLQLGVTKAQATASFTDDIAALQALQDGIRRQIKETGLTADLSGQLFDAQQNLAQARKNQRNARQFRELGLTATGDEITPGVKNLQKRLKQLSANVAGTKFDTPKLQTELAKFRKVLAEKLTPPRQEVRAKIKAMMDDIADELKNSGKRNLTLFHKTNSGAVLAGLDLTRDQRKALRGRLATIGVGGTVPGSRSLAFGGGGDVVVHQTTTLDGKPIARTVTRHQQKGRKRRTSSRRGTNAGQR